ncbi:unnamed protein product [Aphis gossypii]|uniref:Uncharacterized protein n=1 Tax=Aphis gossypii TaxID=80765 RepID=A0A9P0ND21_APHGO|nr:unnamed protein product [Aphis gossypii]
MESSKILGILCRKCNHLMGLNDKNHKCSETQPKKYTFQKIQTKDANESSNTISSKPCIISDFMAEIEQEEHSNTSISENIDDDDN